MTGARSMRLSSMKCHGLDAVDALWGIAGASRLHEMIVRTERPHPALARSRRHASSRAGEHPAAGVLEELARIVRESGRLNRQT